MCANTDHHNLLKPLGNRAVNNLFRLTHLQL